MFTYDALNLFTQGKQQQVYSNYWILRGVDVLDLIIFME